MPRRLQRMAMTWTYVCTYSHRLLFPFQRAIFVKRFLYFLFTHKLHTNYPHVSYTLLCSCLSPYDRVSQQERLLHSASTAVSLLWHSYIHIRMYVQSISNILSFQYYLNPPLMHCITPQWDVYLHVLGAYCTTPQSYTGYNTIPLCLTASPSLAYVPYRLLQRSRASEWKSWVKSLHPYRRS